MLLLDRFDREGEHRIGYISAMTLLEAQDGQPHDYTEIGEVLPPRFRLATGPCIRHQPEPGPCGAARDQRRRSLTGNQARTILREVAEAAEGWESVARRNGIPQAEIARFESTLNHTVNAVRLS